MTTSEDHFTTSGGTPTAPGRYVDVATMVPVEMEFDLDGDVRTMRAGDVAVIPSWVPHGAHTADTTCREIDVFSPPRKSLLAYARTQADAEPEA